MPTRLQLHHHVNHSKYALVKEADEWRQEFNSLKEAVDFAAEMGAESLPLIELDDQANVISETRIRTTNEPHR